MTSPSGKSISIDKQIGKPAPKPASSSAEPVPPGAGGWYTIVTNGFEKNAFDAQRQLGFRNDFIMRMKLTQPTAIFRDLQLMPRVTEPGVHEFVIASDGPHEGQQDVDMQCESGRYYMSRNMQAPPLVEKSPERIEAEKRQALAQFKIAKLVIIPNERIEQMVRDESAPPPGAVVDPNGAIVMKKRLSSIMELNEGESLHSVDRCASVPPPQSTASFSRREEGTRRGSIARECVFAAPDGREIKRKMILSEAQKTLAPFKDWLVKECKRETKDGKSTKRNNREENWLALPEEAYMMPPSPILAPKPKPKTQKKRSRAELEDEEEWVETPKTKKPAARPDKKVKVSNSPIEKEIAQPTPAAEKQTQTKGRAAAAKKETTTKKAVAAAPLKKQATRQRDQTPAPKKNNAAQQKQKQDQTAIKVKKEATHIPQLPAIRKHGRSVGPEEQDREAKRHQMEPPTKLKLKRNPAIERCIKTERGLTPSRKRPRPVEPDDAEHERDNKLSTKKQAAKKPLSSTIFAKENRNTMKNMVNKQAIQDKNKSSPQKEKKRIVLREEPSEDEDSTGYDSEDSVEGRPQQNMTSQQAPATVTLPNMGELVPAGIDPETGNPLFTVQMPQELAAAMASLPAGTRITGLPGMIPPPVPAAQQAITAPPPSSAREVFIPFTPAVTQQIAVASESAVGPAQSQNPPQQLYNSVMNDLAATLNSNPALAQSIFQALVAQRAGLQSQSQSQSQLPGPATPMLPPATQSDTGGREQTQQNDTAENDRSSARGQSSE